MSKSRKPAPSFNIESWDWGSATAEAEMACAHAETILKELPQEELSRVHAAALEYRRTEGEAGSMDELDRIAEAAIRKATAEWESPPQSGHSLSIYPFQLKPVCDGMDWRKAVSLAHKQAIAQ